MRVLEQHTRRLFKVLPLVIDEVRKMNKYYKKLVRIGENSLGVILPIAWTRYNNLRGGDFVTVISNDEVVIRLLPKGMEIINGELKRKNGRNNR